MSEPENEWVPVAMPALEFYHAVERGDYCELVWVDGRRQVKIEGVMLLVGDAKPVMVVGTRGEVVYRLAESDKAVILVRRGAARRANE